MIDRCSYIDIYYKNATEVHSKTVLENRLRKCVVKKRFFSSVSRFVFEDDDFIRPWEVLDDNLERYTSLLFYFS